MTYTQWLDTHLAKHKKIIEKLSHMSDEQIIDYFEYENMREKESDFCLLYAQNVKCHNTQQLNCYLCACPHFRFCDDGIEVKENKTLFSFCDINSSKGSLFESQTAIHQDCSNCFVPHTKAYIKKVFNRDLGAILKQTSLKKIN